MKKKVNWKDKDLIATAIENSESYSDTLKRLGLKPVSANTATLKKYIMLYNLDVSHFNASSPAFVRKKGVVSDTETPHVEIIGDGVDPKEGIKIELDWNDAFIDYLKDNGYKGTDDESIVQLWITHLYQNITESMSDAEKSKFAD